jgi:hypothetical protein
MDFFTYTRDSFMLSHSKSSTGSCESMLGHFSAFMAEYQPKTDIELAEVTPKLAMQFRNYLVTRAELNPNTAKLYLQKFNSIFNHS